MSIQSSTLGGRTKIKLVLLGDQGVGKSAIIQRFVNDRFIEVGISTVGIDFMVKNVLYKNRGFRLQLWDTAGQERFRSLIPSYLKDAVCCLVVFDVSRKESLMNAVSWLQLYKDSKQEPRRAILVGNKIDLNVRTVSKTEGQQVAKNLHIPYLQVSAKTGKRLEDLFNMVIQLSVFTSITENLGIVEEQKKERQKQRGADGSTSGASNKQGSQQQGSNKEGSFKEGSFKQGNVVFEGKTEEKSFVINKAPQKEQIQKNKGCSC